ncbi:nuclease-related domain-containing protein [Neobacillus mesonae]|uniref:nuclease-related domain-containing protein n=1 Tax=Neobacillus mesonae TaxID=1193713 RepID=UPI00203F48BA|nr:nuclease-related domain-containing protein [Neobacillus mesonae]MCM3567531.1 NERD domain-containing protein [Neobacillus mesonae]
MKIGPRTAAKNLLVLRSLNARMTLAEQDYWNYIGQEKGFEGELQFDLLTDNLQNQCIVLKGLLLEIGGNEFQIDTVMIFQDTIHLYDVKNYKGEYYYESGKLYRANGNIAKDLLSQLQRCESLFIKLLQELGFDFRVEARLVFIHPEFTLMQAPKEYPIVYPTQVKNYVQTLNFIPARLTKSHEILVQQLLSMHKSVSSHMRMPFYAYENLIKGMLCKLCFSLETYVDGNWLVCRKCGHKEPLEAAVVRNVQELLLLFPGMKITTNGVHEWCGMVLSKKTIRRILLKYYRSVGKTKVRYFLIE